MESDEDCIDNHIVSDDMEESKPEFKLSFTNFLFGNINEKGELIDDNFLDEDTKRHLQSLERLGVNASILNEIRVETEDNSRASNQSQSNLDLNKSNINQDDEDEDDDYNVKSLSAIDFSDINEMVDEIPEEEEKFREALSQLQFKMPTAPLRITNDSKKLNDVDDNYDDDFVNEKNTKDSSQKKDERGSFKDSDKNSLDSSKTNHLKRKLDTPLAAMLPSKYEDCDVTDLFPEFRHNKVLRFSRLFGPTKVGNLPQIWKNVKSRKKKKKSLSSLSLQTGNEIKDTEAKEEALVEAKKEHEEFELDISEPPGFDQLESDGEEILKRHVSLRFTNGSDNPLNGDENKPKIADWRYGPAQLWYDMLGVPEAGESFDYGFKIQPFVNQENENIPEPEKIDSDDCFHMVTQMQWEDDIIWSGEDIKQKVLAKLNEKYHAAGWVPSGVYRTASAFTKQVRGTTISSVHKPSTVNTQLSITTKGSRGDKSKCEAIEPEKDETWYSIFPVENDELVYGLWEDDVIWDAENMPKIPEPRTLTLDPNDENIVLGIPDDIDPNAARPKEAQPIPLKEKKEHHLRKSRILLGKAGVIAEQEPESPPPPQTLEKDPFNISNDEYYNPKLTQDTALKPTVGGNLIQHSIPALELRQPFFPTFMGPMKLRSFHRPQLKRFSHGTIADALPHGVIPLVKHIKKKAKQREQERLASGGGEMFFMRTPEDLSGKDGDIILAEYSEEHPPLMMQVGMATKIKNYYKRKPGKEVGPISYKYGELAYAHTSPFLGHLAPGQSLQAFENNLFRAPIYEHQLPETQFLVIRTRNNYFIREVDTIFTVGQDLPLTEVPGPNSKKANNFIRDFLQIFIYRLFWRSTDNPRRIKMEDIKKAFPAHSESSIRKRLKLCADFKRTGNGLDSNWWVLKPDFRLPTEDEMRAMVSPEQCCAYYSMIAAEQRLKDAGYGEKSLFAAEDENDEELQLKMDDEVKAAPWNTTRAFIAAMKGKCLLQLNGVADPTGCGEGFSYVRIPNKPQVSKEEGSKDPTPKKTVTGTDADLRRLPLNQAKNLLRKFGVAEDDIKKLSRWEVIDVVRTLSTEKAKAGSEQMSKFARGNRFSIAEHQERYKEECQRIFELQNRILSSNEILSTDEEESEEEDLDIEEMGKNIEKIIENKKSSQQLSLEKEEEERKELQKLIMGEDSNPADDIRLSKKKGKGKDDAGDDSLNLSFSKGRLLKIYRTFRTPDGKEYVRIETVRKPAVIEAYVKIRETKDEEYIRRFANVLDDQEKEEIRREKRRIQEQLRRLKRNAEREKVQLEKKGIYQERSFFSESRDSFEYSLFEKYESKKEKKLKKEKENLRLKCGACGGVGHMRTNRACPLYKGGDSFPPIQVAMTQEQEEEEGKTVLDEDDLVKVDETKVVLSRTLVKHVEEVRRKALVLKVPKEAMIKKRRRKTGAEHCDYLQKPEYKSANRRRTDPFVTLSTILENICLEIRAMDGTELFWTPVNQKLVPDYYKIVQKPMDIQTIRKKVRDKMYRSRDDFLEDVRQMYENSVLYNGKLSVLTTTAQNMVNLCEKRLEEREEKLIKLEKAINPLLDNDQVAFSFILENIVISKLKTIPESWPFHKPVNRRFVRNYYEVIKNPIDLDTIVVNTKEHKYHRIDQFLADIDLVHKNSIQFNGADSQFTKKAEEVLEAAHQAIRENQEQLEALEKSISETKEAALDFGDNDSVMTGGLSNTGNDETSSLPEGGADSIRPSSSAAMSLKDEGDIMDYFDESSRSEFPPIRQRFSKNDQDLSDEERYDQEMHLVGINVEQRDEEIEGGYDIVDENYDPSEFLLEKFNKAAAAGSSAEPIQSMSEEASIPESEDQEERDKMSKLMIEEKQETNDEDDDDDIWF